MTPRRRQNSNRNNFQPKTKGGSCARRQYDWYRRQYDWYRLKFCSSLSEMQSKYQVHPIIRLPGPLDDCKQDHMLPGHPGTRWTRFRSPEKPGYPVANPSPTSRSWRVAGEWHPYVVGWHRSECDWLALLPKFSVRHRWREDSWYVFQVGGVIWYL